MPPTARRFTLVMLAASALFAGAPVLLNYAVDPYDRFGNNRLGIYISAEREVKSTEVARQPHTALIVGNSRMACIAPSRLGRFRFFNGAFSAANAEDVYWFLHHHAHKQELVVLGIDLGAKDPPTLNGDIFRREGLAEAAEHLVNLQTAEYSFKTLFSHWAGKPSHYLPDGSMMDPDFGNLSRRPNPVLEKAYMETLKSNTTGFALGKPRSLSFYRKIAETLRERKITCVVVVPPVHEEVMRHIDTMHLQGESQAWIEELGAIFPNVVNLASSHYGAAENFYAMDPVHYKPEVGVRFMNEEVMPVAMKVQREQGR
jgi:hypothetical protein